MKLLKEIGLFLLANFLYICLFLPAFTYGLRPRKNWYKRVTIYFGRMAYSKDQHGNVMARDLFNYALIKDNSLSFGDPDETISSVLGKNKIKDNLTSVGKRLDYILNRLDNNHSINSIEHDEGY